MSDPLIGPGAGVPGLQTGSVAGTEAVDGPRTGGAAWRTLACLFATRARAEEARQALIDAATPASEIRITSQDAPATSSTTTESGGIWESLKRLFTGEDLESYREGVNRGQTLLTVRVHSEADADRVGSILEGYDPVDLDEQETEWRSHGWTGPHPAAASGTAVAYGTAGERDDTLGTGTAKPAAPSVATTASDLSGRAAVPPGRRAEGEEVIPIVEEQLAVGKRNTGRGSVRVRSYVVETPVEEDVRLREERVQVERRPVSRELGADSAAFQDRTVEMTESREEAVVQKTARVTEEVVVRKDVGERTEHVSDTVRHTEVEVDDQTTSPRTAGEAPRPRTDKPLK
ncbi:conserved protein of unknown function [Rhodovastum atsumiense]|uniref:DUF2382 domain-containing protein n=1 Tax=Rhodovastum atsumiense TaxID=504468 RepID=A0A5M6INC6_9PROT|nr:YsnF/AvaK domain-containing protein [Rhodovastum atsumiense]KAA5609764.1 DUF2382 domain-containing protein [Rhodovastum atsumiense]CAH2599459.1 conserved protein of unknown function [Rhodovastum atsumiense]